MALAGYSGTPLVRKLGIKPDSRLVLMGAPRGFRAALVDLPAGVRIGTRLDGTPDLAIWFVSSRREVEGRMPQVAATMGQGLWVAWPKKASGIVTDVTEDVIRNAGLAHGIVDYKVCAIDATWSGLKFARRKSKTSL
jgi:hypothetical protein